MTTDGLHLCWLKGRSLWLWFHVWFCPCKYLMYPSGTKEGKYRLERGVEQWRRFITGQEAVITPAEALYIHTAWPGGIQEKYKPQTREQEESRHYIPTAPHLPKPEPQLCVIQSTPTSSGAKPCELTRDPAFQCEAYVQIWLSLVSTWQRVDSFRRIWSPSDLYKPPTCVESNYWQVPSCTFSEEHFHLQMLLLLWPWSISNMYKRRQQTDPILSPTNSAAFNCLHLMAHTNISKQFLNTY